MLYQLFCLATQRKAKVSLSLRLWHADIIIIIQWPVRPRKVLGLLLEQASGSPATIHLVLMS